MDGTQGVGFIRHRRDEKPGSPGRPIGAGLLGAPGTSRQVRGSQPKRPDKVKERIVGSVALTLAGRGCGRVCVGPEPAIGTTASLWCERICRWPNNDIRYFFYITNRSSDQIDACEWCNQENLIEQRTRLGDAADQQLGLHFLTGLDVGSRNRTFQKYQAEKQTVLPEDVPERLHARALPALLAALETRGCHLVSCRGCVASTSAMLTGSWV